jgi:MoaA/NifB/PqqE/SkfB family radical SAM enzyme
MVKLVDQVWDKHGNNVFWSLTGGEPTIHPKFLDLCKYIKHEKGAKFVSVTTNGSRTLDYHKKLFENLDAITLSFHFEFMERRVDEYIHKCIELDKWRREWNEARRQEEGQFPNWNTGLIDKTLILRFMVEPKTWHLIERMENAFREAGITNIEHRNIRPLVGSVSEYMPEKKFELDKNYHTANKEEIVENEKPDLKKNVDKIEDYYTPEEADNMRQVWRDMEDRKKKLSVWMKDSDGNVRETYRHYNEVTFERWNNFKGWYCWAGSKHMKITPPGDVYVGSCHVGGKRGNIYDPDNIDLPTDPIVCPLTKCHDNLDLKVPKIKDMDYYHLVEHMVGKNDKHN